MAIKLTYMPICEQQVQVVVMHKYCLMSPPKNRHPQHTKSSFYPGAIYTPSQSCGSHRWTSLADERRTGGVWWERTPNTSAIHSPQRPDSPCKERTIRSLCTTARAATFRPQTLEFPGCFLRTDYLESYWLPAQARVR